MIAHTCGTKWTEAQIAELREHYAEKKQKEWAEFYGISLSAFKSLVYKHRIKKAAPIPWTEERNALLIRSYSTANTEELARKLGTTRMAVIARAHKLQCYKVENFNLPTLRRYAFKPGNIPYNKGRKMEEYASAAAIERIRANQFKRGHVPANSRPVGYERTDSLGYVLIRTAHCYKAKHVVLWESANGPVPPHHIVTFRDGNKKHITLDNLQLMSQTENLARQSINTLPPKLQLSIRLLAALNSRIKKIQQENKL